MMPILAHPDLLSTYVKSGYFAFEGRLFPGKFALGWLLSHALFIKIISFFWPAVWQVLKSEPVTMEAYNKLIFADYNIFQLLVLLKLPFLIMEAITVFTLSKLRFFKTAKHRFLLYCVWLFNPILIFTLYAHGRGEVLVLMMLALFWWMVEQKRFWWSSLILGVSIATRLYPILILPFYLVALPVKKNHTVSHLALMSIPMLFSILIFIIFKDTNTIAVQQAPVNNQYLFPLFVEISYGMKLYIYPLVMGLFWLWATVEEKVNLINLWRYAFAAFLITLSLIFFHPQYYAWLAIYWPMFWVKFRNKSKLIFLFSIQLLGWAMVLLFWGDGLTVKLLSPLNPEFFGSIGSPNNLFHQYFPGIDLVSLGRTLLAIVNFYLVYVLIFTRENLKWWYD